MVSRATLENKTIKPNHLQYYLGRKKALQFLLVLLENGFKDNYASRLSKRIGSTYSHTTAITKELEMHGLIVRDHENRNKHIQLTEKGRRIAHCLLELNNELMRSD